MKKSYNFPYEKACRHYEDRDSGRHLWVLTMLAKDLPSGLSLGANARFSNMDSATSKVILQTLAENPGDFVFLNNGILVVADNIQARSGRVIITFDESDDPSEIGHGIVNGGHTYNCIRHALDNFKEYPDVGEARVMLTVCTGIDVADPADIAAISRARNTSTPVSDWTLRGLGDAWREIWDVIDKMPATVSLIQRKENDPDKGPYCPKDIVQRMALFDIESSPAIPEASPRGALTSPGRLAKDSKNGKSGFNEARIRRLAHLLPDIFALEDLVYQGWEGVNCKNHPIFRLGANDRDKRAFRKVPEVLLTGRHSDISCTPSFVFPVMAAFRQFLVKDKTGKYVFAESVESLWDKYGVAALDAVYLEWLDNPGKSVIYFGRSKAPWKAAFTSIQNIWLQAFRMASAGSLPV